MVQVPISPATGCWRTSSRSGEGSCVQVTGTPEYVWVRDSKNTLGPVLGFTREEWTAFLAGVQHGELDHPGS